MTTDEQKPADSFDVAASFEDVPVWAVLDLYNRVRTELGEPDMAGASASLNLDFARLSADQLVRLRALYVEFFNAGEIMTKAEYGDDGEQLGLPAVDQPDPPTDEPKGPEGKKPDSAADKPKRARKPKDEE